MTRIKLVVILSTSNLIKKFLTIKTASLTARVSISAQETVDGQAFSTLAFIASMTSKPLAEFLFGKAFFSPLKVLVSSSNTDPSHPCVPKQKYRIMSFLGTLF